jgi:uncharacterized protein (UPF0264 family)
MTKWLASVQSLEEAQSLLPILPDILDIKNPSQGALGALTVDEVTDIVNLVNKRCQTSATVGDLIMDASIIGPAIVEMAKSGVDYVKIGLFPADNLSECIADLKPYIKSIPNPVIAVIFADKPVGNVQSLLNVNGFAGVMVDTAIKDGKHLLEHMSLANLSEFILFAKQQELLCGLAGALRLEDIARLKHLGADYLGFRSALCIQRQRKKQLQLSSAVLVKREIEK